MLKTLWSLILILFCSQLQAQNLPKVSETYLIKGAIVTTHPESLPLLQDILIKDGIIQEVGPKIMAPITARIIKADSMYMYAGFIAPASHIGIDKPKDASTTPEIKRPGYPPNDVAGITPEAIIDDVYILKRNQSLPCENLDLQSPILCYMAKCFPDRQR